MAERPFDPLDQYQPFVDENGRITPEWYSWLKLLCSELNTLELTRRRTLKAFAPEGDSNG